MMGTIKICPFCQGEGRNHIKDNEGWDTVKCTKCNGTGRLITGIYNYEVPFSTDQNLIRKADDQIFKVVTELQIKAYGKK